MLSMKAKKPMKPMLEILAITDDAGLSKPNHPASAPTRRPSHPIHRGSVRVVRMATAYSGTTTPKPRKLPAALVTRATAANVSAVAASVACRWFLSVAGWVDAITAAVLLALALQPRPDTVEFRARHGGDTWDWPPR